MLIASARWRVFASATITALALAAATALVFGPQVWIDFIAKGLPTNNLVLADPERIATPFYPTIFMNLRVSICRTTVRWRSSSVLGPCGRRRVLGVSHAPRPRTRFG